MPPRTFYRDVSLSGFISIYVTLRCTRHYHDDDPPLAIQCVKCKPSIKTQIVDMTNSVMTKSSREFVYQSDNDAKSWSATSLYKHRNRFNYTFDDLTFELMYWIHQELDLQLSNKLLRKFADIGMFTRMDASEHNFLQSIVPTFTDTMICFYCDELKVKLDGTCYSIYGRRTDRTAEEKMLIFHKFLALGITPGANLMLECCEFGAILADVKPFLLWFAAKATDKTPNSYLKMLFYSFDKFGIDVIEFFIDNRYQVSAPRVIMTTNRTPEEKIRAIELMKTFDTATTLYNKSSLEPEITHHVRSIEQIADTYSTLAASRTNLVALPALKPDRFFNWCIRFQSVEICAYLLENGAEPDVTAVDMLILADELYLDLDFIKECVELLLNETDIVIPSTSQYLDPCNYRHGEVLYNWLAEMERTKSTIDAFLT